MWNVLQCRTFQLQAPIGTSDVTIAVKNLADIYGNDVEMTGSIQYATLEPESANNQEIISFTGITSVSTNVWNLTGVTRGLDAQPTNGVYGNDVANRRAHASSVDCILSDSPQVWDDKTSKSEAETITGVWTFSASPIVPTPTTADQAATKDYVDGVVASGAADAGTNTKGISRLSYSPTVTIGTATMTIASPCVVSFTAHGLTLNDSVQFTTTGALPTWLNVSTNYFVISTGLTADAFQVSASLGWAAINTSGSQSGTHTLYKTTPVAVGSLDTRLPTQSENDALVGTFWTPSSTNRYVTETNLTGVISMYSGATAPTGYLLCDASAVSRTTYAALFAIISTTYGAGDGSTTFNVPDLRGRVPIGVWTGTGGGSSGTGTPTGGSALTAVARAGWKWEETHTMTSAEMVAHTHQMFANGGWSPGGVNVFSGGGGGGVVNTGNAGNTTPFNVIQPVMWVNFIIKT